MNRAERRRRGIKEKEPTYNVSMSQLQQMVKGEIDARVREVRDTSISFTSRGMAASFIISLHDEFGFGPQRLNKLMERVQNQFECIEAGTVSLNDLIDWCKEYGVDIGVKED